MRRAGGADASRVGSAGVTSSLDHLHRKARSLARAQLAEDEEIVTVVAGRSKQAMIVTDQRILLVKPGLMAGAWLGPKAASFPLATITTVNIHGGRGIAALELVIAGRPSTPKPDLTTAFQLPNWLPCHPSVGSSPMVEELRAYVQSDGRSRTARAELSSAEGGSPGD
jgi:hypothetical protein